MSQLNETIMSSNELHTISSFLDLITEDNDERILFLKDFLRSLIDIFYDSNHSILSDQSLEQIASLLRQEIENLKQRRDVKKSIMYYNKLDATTQAQHYQFYDSD